MKLNIFPLLLIAAIALNVTSAAAGGVTGIVFDPTNFSQNIITAAKTTATYIKQLEQYATQLNQLRLLNSNSLLRLVDPKIAEVAGELNRVAQAVAAAKNLEAAIGKSGSMATDLKALYGATSMSPADFAANIAQRRAAGDKMMERTMTAYKSNNEVVKDSAASLTAIAKTITGAEGTNQLLQGLNKSVMVMVQQNNALLEATQLQNIKTGKELADQDRNEQGKKIMLNVHNARQTKLDALLP